MPTRRTSEEEEDYHNNEEEDCAAASAAAAATMPRHKPLPCTAATAATAAVAAVVAAWRSGLRRGAVAAAADSRMPSLTPVFLCLLTECSLLLAQNTSSFVLPSGFRPDSVGFWTN